MTPFRIDPQPASVLGAAALERPEGVAFSRDGSLVAVADAGANRVLVHERCGGPGLFAAEPVSVIEGPESGLDYPHDVDFSPDDGLLVVANRMAPSLTFHAREPGTPPRYAARPVGTIRGRASGLASTGGVQFVPPAGDYVAAINRKRSSVTFYRRRRGWLPGPPFARRPCFSLRGAGTRIVHPDGLAFSPDGGLLAVSNHSVHSVTLYARTARGPRYRAEPIAEIRGEASRLRYPHSLAFSPDGGHLAVSSAGGRSVTVYRRDGDGPPWCWPSAPVLELGVGDPVRFEAINRRYPEEGGGKGVAFGRGCFAVCHAATGLCLHPVQAGP